MWLSIQFVTNLELQIFLKEKTMHFCECWWIRVSVWKNHVVVACIFRFEDLILFVDLFTVHLLVIWGEKGLSLNWICWYLQVHWFNTFGTRFVQGIAVICWVSQKHHVSVVPWDGRLALSEARILLGTSLPVLLKIRCLVYRLENGGNSIQLLSVAFLSQSWVCWLVYWAGKMQSWAMSCGTFFIHDWTFNHVIMCFGLKCITKKFTLTMMCWLVRGIR